MAGDFSPLTIEAGDGRRQAPPALVVAMAVGLGSVDMPVPLVAEWEWLNWKFPRAVHAGDTIYARWTLTQKRPPVGGAPSSIVVWRVDVHTADGTLCAEGEVGAKVKRSSVAALKPSSAPAPAPRRRRRRSRNNGAAVAEPAPAIAAPPATPARPEKAAGTSRRRRRRRSSTSGSAGRGEDAEPREVHREQAMSTPPAASPAPAPRSGLGGVLRRLRGTS